MAGVLTSTFMSGSDGIGRIRSLQIRRPSSSIRVFLRFLTTEVGFYESTDESIVGRLSHTTKGTEKNPEPFEMHMQTDGELMFYIFNASHHNFKPDMMWC